ncbi:MAG TPA: hypothetical protein VHK64_08180 [Nocardioidaceae bacterium]|jgi:hypothetical protein|nr:hypothetical protein [Nocardioidaceae bacterium]
MSITPDSVKLETLIAGPLWIVLTVALVALALGLARSLRRNELTELSDGEAKAGIGIVAFAVLVVQLANIWGFWPLDMSYHRWYKVDGTVEQVGSRQIADGNAMSTRYVLQLGGQPFGVDDTRAALAKPGDTVHLKCAKEWQYNSDDPGWACIWNGRAEAGAR